MTLKIFVDGAWQDILTPEQTIAYRKVVAAWMDAGSHPSWHHRMQAKLRLQMPILYRALRELEEANRATAPR